VAGRTRKSARYPELLVRDFPGDLGHGSRAFALTTPNGALDRNPASAPFLGCERPGVRFLAVTSTSDPPWRPKPTARGIFRKGPVARDWPLLFVKI